MTSHPSDRPVSALRARMFEDMKVCAFSEKTRNDYIRNVRGFAAFIGRSPPKPFTVANPRRSLAAANGSPTIIRHTERMDEDQLYVEAPPYRPRPVTEMISADPIAERLAQ